MSRCTPKPFRTTVALLGSVLVLALLFGGGAMHGAAWADGAPSVEARWEAWTDARDDYARALASLQRELEAYESRMARLERTKAEALLLGRGLAGLRAELSAAHADGVRLTEQDAALRTRRTALESERQRMVLWIQEKLEEQDLGSEDRARWTERLSRIATPVHAPSRISVEDLLAAPMYTPEQVRAALDELRDLEAAVQRSLHALEEEVRRARLRDRLEAQRAGWAWEEAHLESGERRARARRGAEEPIQEAATEPEGVRDDFGSPVPPGAPPLSEGDMTDGASPDTPRDVPPAPPAPPPEPTPAPAPPPAAPPTVGASPASSGSVDARRATEGVRAPAGAARTQRSRTSSLEEEREALETELRRIRREQRRLQDLGTSLEE